MVTQLSPNQVKGLEYAYKDLEKLSKNTKGIKIATWIGAISMLISAITGIIIVINSLLKK